MKFRLATPSDALAVARVHVRSWQVGYRGLISDEYLDSLRPEERASRYTFGQTDPLAPTTMVAEIDGTIRGFVTTVPARDEDAKGSGEIVAFYVDPDAWSAGIGAGMMRHARATLRERGFESAVLWMLKDNARADRFYQRDGWRLDGSERGTTVWQIDITEVRYRRATLEDAT